MQICEQTTGDFHILRIEGRLDHSGAGTFQERALQRIAEGSRAMVVDFGGTSFVASLGIRAVMVPAQEMSRVGGKFLLAGLSPQVRQLFEISGLLQVFPVFPTVDDAVRG
jgi:anti-sigma B factor antagonist